jgi:exosortase
MRFWVPLGGLGILFALLYVPVARDLYNVWDYDQNYSHGFLIPFFAFYLVWLGRDALAVLRPKPWNAGLVVIAAAVFMRLIGALVETVGAGTGGVFANGVSFILALAGFSLTFLGKEYFKKLVFPLAYLGFMVPLPGGLFAMITLPLQNYATAVTTAVLKIWGIPVLREGNLITLPGLTLGVVEACSGIRSLFTLLALSAIFALVFMVRHRPWQRILLFVSAIPVAIITNAFRVTATGVMSHYWGEEAAQGFYHDFSGWVIFIVAFAILATEVFFFNKLVDEVD